MTPNSWARTSGQTLDVIAHAVWTWLARGQPLSSDLLQGTEQSFGLILEYPEAKIFSLSEEHANVDFENSLKKPVIGERVTVIPNHTCVVNNLHHEIIGVREEKIDRVWPVEARDCSR